MAEAQSVRNQIVLVGISGFLLDSIFLAYFISHSISAPLKELHVRKMHDTGNDAGAEAEVLAEAHGNAGGKDELGRAGAAILKRMECGDQAEDPEDQRDQCLPSSRPSSIERQNLSLGSRSRER